MSRSRQHGKGPCCGRTRMSEAEDKARANRALRRETRRALAGETDPPVRAREVSDRWGFTKSG